MKKILFPTEFSDHSPEVFKYAADMAFFFKAKLVMIHIFGKPNLKNKDEAMDHMAEVVTDQMVALVDNNLQKEYRDSVKIEYVAQIGLPGDTILQYANDEDIDMIVMGTKGKTNELEIVLGSVSMKVLEQADCPVLLIPKDVTFKGIDHIVFTTNFEFRDLGALSYLRKWGRAFEATINTLHIVEPGEDAIRAMHNMSILKGTFKSRKRMDFHLTEGDFYETIEDFTARKKADVIAMMSHKRNFISRLLEKRNTVKGVAKNAEIPLLVIKDNAYEIDTETVNWLELFNSLA